MELSQLSADEVGSQTKLGQPDLFKPAERHFPLADF